MKRKLLYLGTLKTFKNILL